ncbi:hypothetical protein D3C81_1581110 [compost metagenome]
MKWSWKPGWALAATSPIIGSVMASTVLAAKYSGPALAWRQPAFMKRTRNGEFSQPSLGSDSRDTGCAHRTSFSISACWRPALGMNCPACPESGSTRPRMRLGENT